jgi:hypothetical protein
MTATFCNVPSGPSEGGYGFWPIIGWRVHIKQRIRSKQFLRNSVRNKRRVCIDRRRWRPQLHPAMPEGTAVQRIVQLTKRSANAIFSLRSDNDPLLITQLVKL